MTPGEFNATIAPGDQTAITFLANVTTSNPAPSAFFVNGVQCDQPSAGGRACGTASESSSMTLSCPSGTITSIEFASYGNPDGACGAFTQGSCHAASSLSVVSSACLGQASCTVSADNGTFGDPCFGTVKRLYAQVRCDGGAGGTGDTGGTGGAGGTAGRPFSADSPWNTPIAAGASIHPDSATLVADLATSAPQRQFWINMDQNSIPLYFADASTPTTSVTANSVGGEGFGSSDTRSGVQASIPIPAGAMPAAGDDHHLCIIDLVHNVEWGLWGVSVSGNTYACEVGARMDLTGTGVRQSTNIPPWWMGHGACGYGLSAGLITVEEIQAGQINHALVLAYPHIRSRYFTFPASTAQSFNGQAGSLYADSSPTALQAWSGVLSSGHLAAIDLQKVTELCRGRSRPRERRNDESEGGLLGQALAALPERHRRVRAPDLTRQPQLLRSRPPPQALEAPGERSQARGRGVGFLGILRLLVDGRLLVFATWRYRSRASKADHHRWCRVGPRPLAKTPERAERNRYMSRRSVPAPVAGG